MKFDVKVKKSSFTTSNFGYFSCFVWTNCFFHPIFPYKPGNVIHFEKVLHRQIFWYQNVWGLYRKPKQNNFANTVGIKCLSNCTPHLKVNLFELAPYQKTN